MATRLANLAIVDRAARMRERLAIVVIAFGLGVPTGAAIVDRLTPPIVHDPAMEKACQYPTQEGELTVAVILDNRLVCWRYR